MSTSPTSVGFGGVVGCGGATVKTLDTANMILLCSAFAHFSISLGFTHCQPSASGSPQSQRPSLCVSIPITQACEPSKDSEPGTLPSPWIRIALPSLCAVLTAPHPAPVL